MGYDYIVWLRIFFVIQYYLQSVPVYSANCGSGYGSVADCCDHGTELFGFINGQKILSSLLEGLSMRFVIMI
jgi:hypothetical protein